MKRSVAVADLALLSAILLVVLCVVWETVAAPLHPGAWVLSMKAIPMALALPGLVRRDAYTLQWAAMLDLCYFAEGIVRVMTDSGNARILAALEILLCLIFFCAALAHVGPLKRAARSARQAHAPAAAIVTNDATGADPSRGANAVGPTGAPTRAREGLS